MNFLKNSYPYLLALFAGCILPLAFAPYNYWWLAILSPAILLLLLRNCSLKSGFIRGYLYGVGYAAVGVSWVYISIHYFGYVPIPLALLLTAMMVLILAVYIGLFGIGYLKLFPRDSFTNHVLAFPAMWVLFEALRGWGLGGWLFIGNSQIDSPLHGLGPILGVYGMSFATIVTSGLLVNLFIKKSWKNIIFIAILWSAAFGLTYIHWTRATGKPIQVSLIQGNIPQSIKWDPQQVENTMIMYRQLTLQHLDSSLIVWPEAAITITSRAAANYLANLNAIAIDHNTSIIVGIPIEARLKFYNGMMVLGKGHGTYYKRHLLPFGEYLPLAKYLSPIFSFLNIPMSNLSPGSFDQPLLKANGLTIAPYICYEIAYSREVLRTIHNAQVIVVGTDDSWFGRSIASYQHVQIAQLSALETGRYLLFSTNNGVTAIINPRGNVVAQLPRFKRAVLTYKIYAMQGKTPLMVIGIYPILITLLLVLIILILACRYRESKRYR